MKTQQKKAVREPARMTLTQRALAAARAREEADAQDRDALRVWLAAHHITPDGEIEYDAPVGYYVHVDAGAWMFTFGEEDGDIMLGCMKCRGHWWQDVTALTEAKLLRTVADHVGECRGDDED